MSTIRELRPHDRATVVDFKRRLDAAPDVWRRVVSCDGRHHYRRFDGPRVYIVLTEDVATMVWR